jgi:hypothetical protein
MKTASFPLIVSFDVNLTGIIASRMIMQLADFDYINYLGVGLRKIGEYSQPTPDRG